MVKPGACIIDVGISRIIDPATGHSKLVGDVDFEGKQKHPSTRINKKLRYMLKYIEL